MAKLKNKTGSLKARVSTPAKLPPDLVNLSSGGVRSSSPGISRIGAEDGMHAESLSSLNKLAGGIKFGSSSSTSQSSGSTGSEWSKLLKQTASGGVSSALSGGLSGFLGLGGIISGITGLFGGGSKKTSPPLVEFALPNSQDQTLVLGTGSGTPAISSGPIDIGVPVNNTGRTGASNAQQVSGSVTGASAATYNNAQIVQAVRNALLTSSTLNDVIADI